MNDVKFTSWIDVKMEDGFWKQWQDTVAKSTSRAIYNRFKETGRIDAMKLDWEEGMPNKPHEFWDSDIAKWMEGTAYLLYFYKDSELEAKLNEVIGYIEQGQDKDGYFNSAFLTCKPDEKFKDRTAHELYTAGHLIEASVAHYYSTGSKRFLDMMCRFADYIEKVFVIEETAHFKTPGHQELELALVRLWHATGEKRYLELSKHFVDTRGTAPVDKVFSVTNGTYPADPALGNQLYYNDTYAQDDAPARELPGASGHAVRAMYFYTAMADLAKEYEDEDLLVACNRLWNDSVNKKMYITGGVSAERFGEAIGTEYVLPNDHSYAETCASVAMANFSQRMFICEQDSKFADMIEHQMYNGALVGLSIDGEGFFYDNALRSRPEMNKFFEGIHATPLLPANERLKVFECSCCPPNIYRFIAALSQYFYSVKENVLYIHQYSPSKGTAVVEGTKVNITQKTHYPWDGQVAIKIEVDKPTSMVVAVRIPQWCQGAKVSHNGKEIEVTPQKGYVYIDSNWNTGDEITLDLPMEIVQMESHPNVVNAVGRVALKRGPIVYCLEGNDNTCNIFDLILANKSCYFTTEEINVAGLPVIALKGQGLVRNASDWENALYKPFEGAYQTTDFMAIPYFAWANRGENDMTVWIKKQI